LNTRGQTVYNVSIGDNAVLKDSIITCNLGRGVTMSGGTLQNCLISANGDPATNNYGIVQTGGAIVNCTVVRSASAGIYQNGGVVSNTIVWHNNDGDPNILGPTTNYWYSCTPELANDPVVTHNINHYPWFRDDGAGYGQSASSGDYRLQTRSPCVNAAYKFPWMEEAGALDIAGEARILNRYPDMGAYETLRAPTGTIIIIR